LFKDYDFSYYERYTEILDREIMLEEEEDNDYLYGLTQSVYEKVLESIENRKAKPYRRINTLIKKFGDLYYYDIEKIADNYYCGKPTVYFSCEHHGKIQMSMSEHYRVGCYKCYQYNNMSIGETAIKNFLERKNIEYVNEHSFEDCKSDTDSNLRFDFYIPKKNMCIEFDGRQHYSPVEHFGGEEKFKRQVFLDSIKDNYCKNKNIPLLRIPYWEINNIEKIISTELNSI